MSKSIVYQEKKARECVLQIFFQRLFLGKLAVTEQDLIQSYEFTNQEVAQYLVELLSINERYQEKFVLEADTVLTNWKWNRLHCSLQAVLSLALSELTAIKLQRAPSRLNKKIIINESLLLIEKFHGKSAKKIANALLEKVIEFEKISWQPEQEEL